MKNDLIFSCIAIPFTIGFGIASCEPLWAMAIFAAMLLLRYTSAPSTSMGNRHRYTYRAFTGQQAPAGDSTLRHQGQSGPFARKIAPFPSAQ